MARYSPDFRSHLSETAFAFRGYNVTNLGRTPELLAHPAYGPIVESHLRQASDVCSDVLKRPVDLVARIRARQETVGLETYAEDIATIVAVELAQVRILETHFGVSIARGRLAFGYSLGECTALMAAGVYEMADLLRVPLAVASDCAALAEEVTLSVLFSRGPVLDLDAVRRLCLEISQEGRGVIDVSTYLSPNSLILMGQSGSLGVFEKRIKELFAHQVFFRRNKHRWPPIHTPILWQRNIPNRAGILLQTIPGGFRAPSVPILSMVTGAASYGEFNSRQLLNQWIDHPQRLWDVIYKVLADGIETVVHLGPEPNLLPATFQRLSNNLSARTRGHDLSSLGRRTISRLVQRPWLTRLLPSSAVLFRSLFVHHVILEDWLLAQPTPPLAG